MRHGVRVHVARTAAMLVGVILAPLAFGQNCGSYKGQLEALLVLPAGKYKVDEFMTTMKQKTITLKNGTTAWLDRFGNPVKSPEPSGLVTVATYLEYQLPHSPLKVIDSTTNGRRIANGRLSCTYLLSYPPLNRQSSQEIDVQASDSGKARFFVPTMMGMLLAGNNPNGYAPITAELGAGIAFNLISAGLRERDKRHPSLQENAHRSYAEKLAKALSEHGAPQSEQGAPQNAERDAAADHIRRNAQQAASPVSPATETARGNATPAPLPKSPGEACANRNDLISRAICLAKTCFKAEYQGHPDCSATQPTEGQP